MIKDVSEKRMLEIGVGNGIDAAEFIQAGAIYTGIDVCQNHIAFAKRNFDLQGLKYVDIIESDLLDTDIKDKFDIVYGFGVLHHIRHEEQYLVKLKSLIKNGGELRVGLYSKYSFFNCWITFMWIFRNHCRLPYNVWQGVLTDNSDIDNPLTVKIRSKKKVIELYKFCGFKVHKYNKRGFVQRYIPLIGRYLKPDGLILNWLGSSLGWYHIIIFKIDHEG